MISEYIKYLDVFSQSFQFNSGRMKDRKRTYVGAFLTLSIMIVSIYYFFYLFLRYMENQIDPKFRIQNFVKNDLIQIPLSNDLIAFSFVQSQDGITIDQIQAKTNKTYIVTIATYLYSDSNGFYMKQLNVFPCNNTQLEGYRCIDMSSVPSNYSLILDSNNRAQSQISIQAYRCQDTDMFKQFVPDNCANADDINQFIDNLANMVNVKLITSQYNITSKSFEKNYKTFRLLMSNSQMMFTEFKAQNQITSIKDGFIIQSENQFSSPISYVTTTQALDSKTVLEQEGATYFTEFFLDVEETVYLTQIQFPTFPEILALCNSTLSLLMCLGFLGRQMAQKLIRQELFLLILQNFYQGTYQKILKLHKLTQLSNSPIEKKTKSLTHSAELLENSNPIIVPNFNTKRSIQLTYPQDTDNQKVYEDVIIENQFVKEIKSPRINPDQTQIYQQDYFQEPRNINNFQQDCTNTDHIQKESVSESNKTQGIFNEDHKANEISIAKNLEFRLNEVNINYCNKQILNINQKQESQRDKTKEQRSLSKQINAKKNFEKKQKESLQISPPLSSCRESLRNNEQTNFFQKNERVSMRQNTNNQRQTEVIEINSVLSKDDSIKKTTQTNLEQKLKTLNNQTLLKKLEQILFKFNIQQQQKYLKDKGIDQQTFLSIENQVNRSLDFSQIYQEIMLCKKAVMMILNQEQFAALRFVGCSDQFSVAISSEQKDYSLNHFEKQFATQLIDQRQVQYVNSFIQRCSQNNDLSAIDQRIYQSLI
ncbi:transmembrane protein, putative (macronuclear) [Tetrahymena thermophila SB210]|uniref:Transmembrane protein, putative n=1 Tax=Tetrahymena thermophila (strain SB210) TaxID=312017 RepID=I7MB66_TETTS|nr:transmembrane protein, putative [Tetrahymena thermophila SB210]EAS07743.2 transmembrane protein, putative [Tetrahymena thermophila SB210]|eukprot:XP_001027985.2 transmembrane protein, putative [Tetrahymena thermophila SB210]